MRPLIGAATLLSLGHHIDHMPRGNHVGRPLTSRVTAFTLSMGFYPIIAVGYYFYSHGRLGVAFRSNLAAVGFGFVGITHLGPWALEPPRDILLANSSHWTSAVAFAWLIGFLLVLLVTAGCAGDSGRAAGAGIADHTARGRMFTLIAWLGGGFQEAAP